MRAHRITLVVVTAAGAALASVGAAVASAPAVSQLKVTAATTTIDMASSPSMQVTVKLDPSTCPVVYGHGQDYGVAAISSAPAVATVPVNYVGDLQCGGAGATFQIVGRANGSSIIRFDPVAKAPGLQKKLAGVNFTVDVVNAPTDGNGGNPPSHMRPAAPAVANAYVRTTDALNAACRTAFAPSHGHAWHGAFTRSIAKWSAANHLSQYKETVSDAVWVHFVQTHVDSVCGFTPTASTT